MGQASHSAPARAGSGLVAGRTDKLRNFWPSLLCVWWVWVWTPITGTNA